jgi:lysozyme
MTTSPAVRLTADDASLLASVKLGEGLRFTAYPDPESPLGKQLSLPLNKRAAGWQNLSGAPWTCGYGHTGPDVGPKTCCAEPQAETWLRCDLANAISVLDAEEPWWRTMTMNRQRVFAEMVFNLGYGRFAGFHRMLADAEAGKWGASADEMDASLWARQIGGREKRLSDAFRAG